MSDEAGVWRRSNNNLSILHIEDDPMCAALVAEWLKKMKRIDYKGCAGSLQEGFAMVTNKKIDLILMDINLPDGDGLKNSQKFRECSSKPAIILLTFRLDPEFLLRSSHAQVSGIIYKSGQQDEFANAIESWKAGKWYCSPQYMSALRETLKAPNAYHKILSETEQNLMDPFGSGKSDHEIASLTGLAWGTVRTHRRNVMRKLDLHNSHSLAKWARNNGFTK